MERSISFCIVVIQVFLIVIHLDLLSLGFLLLLMSFPPDTVLGLLALLFLFMLTAFIAILISHMRNTFKLYKKKAAISIWIASIIFNTLVAWYYIGDTGIIENPIIAFVLGLWGSALSILGLIIRFQETTQMAE